MELYAVYSGPGWTDLIYAGSQRIATVAGTQTAAPIYNVLDHLGSEVATVNGGDGAQTSLDHTPFGQVLSGTNSDSFVFTGLQRDPDGLDHADMRQYTSTAGRWITAAPYSGSYDIENPQTLNRYAYVNNNPLGFVDPTGEALGVVNGAGGSLCKAAYLAMQISMTPINPCNPVGSLITMGITAAISSLSLYGSSALTIGSWSVGGSAVGSSVTAAEVGPFVSAALTITCSIDYNPIVCGPKGWASDVIGGNTGKIVGDSLAVTGDALIYEYGPACATALGSPANLACDIVYAVALYTLFNDIFSELFGKSNFKGSLIPRPNVRGGGSPTDVGVPDIGKVSGNRIMQ